VVVSIPLQRAYVFDDGALVASSPVSTGKRGHETPAGTFRILQKKVRHRSSKYDNAPMPYMQRLTNYGIALHAGRLPGYPASHGCIRLPWGFAKKLYGLTDHGTKVTITRSRPKSAEDALRLA
jgi:lipoprotein-anchoring transpeptidase ErfK/SrfK